MNLLSIQSFTTVDDSLPSKRVHYNEETQTMYHEVRYLHHALWRNGAPRKRTYYPPRKITVRKRTYDPLHGGGCRFYNSEGPPIVIPPALPPSKIATTPTPRDTSLPLVCVLLCSCRPSGDMQDHRDSKLHDRVPSSPDVHSPSSQKSTPGSGLPSPLDGAPPAQAHPIRPGPLATER